METTKGTPKAKLEEPYQTPVDLLYIREIGRLMERLVVKDKVIAELVEHLATIDDYAPQYEYPYTVAYRKCGECGHEELIKALPNGCFTSSIDFCTKCEESW